MSMEKQERVALQIRFPVNMYEEIRKRGKKSHRSFNSEIIASLERFFEIEQEKEKCKR